jgi:hypothetical protein
MTTNFPVQDVNARAVYGSNRAGSFIRDAMAGTNSLDVVVFGDSNAGSDGTNGYSYGWQVALAGIGIPTYATPVFHTSSSEGATNRSGGMFGSFIKSVWTGNTTSGAVGTIVSLSYALNTLGDGDADDFNNYLGSSSFDIKPYAFAYDIQFLIAGSTYTSPANGTCIEIAGGNPLTEGSGSGQVPLQYRTVYGKFITTGGKFRLRAMKGVNTLIAGSSADISTAGGFGYATATLNFTSPNSAVENTRVVCSWDGYNGLGVWTPTGPVAIMWHSIIKQSGKGFSVSCLNYYGGRTTTQLATTATNGGKVFESFLKELRERQIAAGGSGRVLWWHNSGINGTETSSTWTTGVSTIVDKVRSVWSSLGYPASDLAFVVSPTHPTNNGAAGDNGWSARGTEVVSGAVNWIQGNNGYASNGVTFVNISALVNAQQLNDRNLYSLFQDAKYESHLRSSPTTASGVTYTDGSESPGGAVYSSGFLNNPDISNNGYIVVCNLITQALLAN